MIFYNTFSMWLVIDLYTYDSYMECPPFCKNSFLEYIIRRGKSQRIAWAIPFPNQATTMGDIYHLYKTAKCYFKATPTC